MAARRKLIPPPAGTVPVVDLISNNRKAQASPKRKASTSITNRRGLRVPRPVPSAVIVDPPEEAIQPRRVQRSIKKQTETKIEKLRKEKQKLNCSLKKLRAQVEVHESTIKEFEELRRKVEYLQTKLIEEAALSARKKSTSKPYICPETGCEEDFWECDKLDEHKSSAHHYKFEFVGPHHTIWTCTRPNCDLEFYSKGRFDTHQDEHDHKRGKPKMKIRTI